MEAAINAFLVTVAIVAGVLSPFILLAIIGAFTQFMKTLALQLEGWVEDVRKRPPFDDVELNLNPMTKILTGRIIKDEQIVWQGSVRRQEDDLL